jgi:sec-independent protein translocase protein TatA
MLVLVIALIVFGGAKLPQIGRSLGKGIKEFQKAVKEIKGDLE